MARPVGDRAGYRVGRLVWWRSSWPQRRDPRFAHLPAPRRDQTARRGQSAACPNRAWPPARLRRTARAPMLAAPDPPRGQSGVRLLRERTPAPRAECPPTPRAGAARRGCRRLDPHGRPNRQTPLARHRPPVGRVRVRSRAPGRELRRAPRRTWGQTWAMAAEQAPESALGHPPRHAPRHAPRHPPRHAQGHAPPPAGLPVLAGDASGGCNSGIRRHAPTRARPAPPPRNGHRRQDRQGSWHAAGQNVATATNLYQGLPSAERPRPDSPPRCSAPILGTDTGHRTRLGAEGKDCNRSHAGPDCALRSGCIASRDARGRTAQNGGTWARRFNWSDRCCSSGRCMWPWRSSGWG
jgi:hypothetical protein